MKRHLFFPVLALTFIFSIAIVFESCKKEEKCPEVDYTAIDKTIDSAQQWHDIAIEGTGPGEYPPPAKNEYQQAIDVAKSVRTKNCVTQQELDNAENALLNSGDYFDSKRIPDCPDVDYTGIDQAIANAQLIHDNAVEGSEPGEYPPGSKAELQQAIDSAQSVRDKQCVSQDELNTATSTLTDAIVEFESNVIPDFTAHLVAHC